MKIYLTKYFWLFIFYFATTSALAQTISLKGIAGKKALVAVNNGQPAFLTVGHKIGDFTIQSISDKDVTFKSAQQSFSLKIGSTRQGAQQPIPAENTPNNNKVAVRQDNSEINQYNIAQDKSNNASANQLVIQASRGHSHFVTDGLYNDKPVNYIIDTGASMVSMSIEDALRLGIDYASGKEAFAETAGGRVKAYIITAPSITVGPITQKNVETLVTSTNFGKPNTLLLGQTFLSKIRLIQEQGQLTLIGK